MPRGACSVAGAAPGAARAVGCAAPWWWPARRIPRRRRRRRRWASGRRLRFGPGAARRRACGAGGRRLPTAGRSVGLLVERDPALDGVRSSLTTSGRRRASRRCLSTSLLEVVDLAVLRGWSACFSSGALAIGARRDDAAQLEDRVARLAEALADFVDAGQVRRDGACRAGRSPARASRRRRAAADRWRQRSPLRERARRRSTSRRRQRERGQQ